MAIDPITLAMLTGAGLEGIQQASNIIPSEFDREQKRRLAALKNREEMNLLGLSEQERNTLEGRLQGRSQAAQLKADSDRARLLASQTATGGQALAQATAQDEARARQEVAIQQAVEEQNLAEKQRETSELRALEASVAQDKEKQKQAIANTFASGAEAGLETLAQNQLIQGSKEASPEVIQTIANTYGIGESEARGLLELSVENPELFQYLNMIKGA